MDDMMVEWLCHRIGVDIGKPLCKNLGQIFHNQLPYLLNSIIWYWLKLGGSFGRCLIRNQRSALPDGPWDQADFTSLRQNKN